jgi:hypothetical protein
MTIDGSTAIVLAYVLVSMGVIIAFLLAVFVIGWFIAAANSAENSNLRGKLSCAGQGRASPYGRARG